MKILRYISEFSLREFREDKIDIGELLKRSISKSIKKRGDEEGILKQLIPIKIIIPNTDK